eukprot:scaffold208572_cov51-Cyclotella_meneghiniana.AAC.3
MKATKKEKEDALWDEKFKALLEYKKKIYNQNPKLGHWVRNQRQFYKKEKMSQDRKDKLEEIGFVWRAARGGTARKNEYNQKWNDMFEQLKVFRVESYEQKLGTWVKTQRMRKETMPQDRIRKLEAIAFVWRPARGRAAQNNSCLNLDKSQFSDATSEGDTIENEFTSLEGISQLPMPPLPPLLPLSPSYMSDTILEADPFSSEIEEFEAQLVDAVKQTNIEDTTVLNESFELEAESLSPQLEVTKTEPVKATKNNANLPSTNEALALQLSDAASRKDVIDTNTKRINTVTHEQDAARGMLESIETEKDSSGIATKDMEFLNIEVMYCALD